MIDRRDLLIGHLNVPSSSPTMNRRAKPHLANRSNYSAMKHNWHLSPSSIGNSHDIFRPRLRERPLLSDISRLIQSRPKSPLISSGTSSPTPTRLDETHTPERRDSSSGIYRNRYIIKFREHNLGQTPSQRRSSITWDLPTTFANVKTSEEVPINEQSELNQDLEGIGAPDSNLETKPKEVNSCDVLNKTENLPEIHKDIKNEEMKEELILDKDILEKSVVNETQTESSASPTVIDIVPIQTVSKIEPSSTEQVALVVAQETSSLKSKDRKPKAANSKTKSPKKKKVKKKETSKGDFDTS